MIIFQNKLPFFNIFREKVNLTTLHKTDVSSSLTYDKNVKIASTVVCSMPRMPKFFFKVSSKEIAVNV